MLQNLYDLADMKVMYEILDSRAFTEFCCINSPDEVPDGDTIGRFRNLLNKYGLQQTIFETVVDLLLQRGLILKKGTIVDSTFIEAPSSTKNKEKKRDPEAHSAKKGNTWHFGYKMHIGVDRDSGLVHHVKTTSANEHDVTATSELMHGEEETLNGDSGYIGADKRPEAIRKNKQGKKIKYIINRKQSSINKLSKSGQYTLMKRYYNNFCTQWVDIQNVKYLKRAPEKRKTYLATISEKILFDNSDYDALEDGVYEFARVCGVPYYEIELTDIQYPDEIEW